MTEEAYRTDIHWIVDKFLDSCKKGIIEHTTRSKEQVDMILDAYLVRKMIENDTIKGKILNTTQDKEVE